MQRFLHWWRVAPLPTVPEAAPPEARAQAKCHADMTLATLRQRLARLETELVTRAHPDPEETPDA